MPNNPDADKLVEQVCQHRRKGKMIDFNEKTFEGTWECRLCGQPFSRKASIVCMEDENETNA